MFPNLRSTALSSVFALTTSDSKLQCYPQTAKLKSKVKWSVMKKQGSSANCPLKHSSRMGTLLMLLSLHSFLLVFFKELKKKKIKLVKEINRMFTFKINIFLPLKKLRVEQAYFDDSAELNI